MQNKILWVVGVGIGGIILFLFGFTLYYHTTYRALLGKEMRPLSFYSTSTHEVVIPAPQNTTNPISPAPSSTKAYTYTDSDLNVSFLYDPNIWETEPMSKNGQINLIGRAELSSNPGDYYRDYLNIKRTQKSFEEFRTSILANGNKIVETNPATVDAKAATQIWYTSSGVEDIDIDRQSTVVFIPRLSDAIVITYDDTRSHHRDFVKNIHILDKATSLPQKNESDLCKELPTSTAMGRETYPIDPKYGRLEFLGELFTASKCSPERMNNIFGVEGENYTAGSFIVLKEFPSVDLFGTLTSVGFTCVEKLSHTDLPLCKQWELNHTVKLQEILKLEPFYMEFGHDDCRNCG